MIVTRVPGGPWFGVKEAMDGGLETSSTVKRCLLSTVNLEKLLRERGLTPVVWERHQPHQPVDFTFAVFLLMSWLAA